MRSLILYVRCSFFSHAKKRILADNHIDGFTMDKEASAREYLTAWNWPQGLQSSLLKSIVNNPVRFFIIDDSGSMASADGHKLISGNTPTCEVLVVTF